MAIVLAETLASCSPLGTFNAIVPQDNGAIVVKRGSAYGIDPRQRIDLTGH